MNASLWDTESHPQRRPWALDPRLIPEPGHNWKSLLQKDWGPPAGHEAGEETEVSKCRGSAHIPLLKGGSAIRSCRDLGGFPWSGQAEGTGSCPPSNPRLEGIHAPCWVLHRLQSPRQAEPGWGEGEGRTGSLGLVGGCKQSHLEWINKVLLDSTGNYIQSPERNHNGRDY